MSKVAKAAIGLMIVTIFTKIIGFAREQVLAYYYGTSMYVAAYVIALNIPTVIFASLGSAIATSLVPMYTSIRQDRGEIEAKQFLNNLIGIVSVICIVILAIGLIFTEPIVRIFAVGFQGEIFDLAVKFTRILFLGIIFTGTSNIMVGYLQIKGNFTIPGLISLPSNIIVITSIILSVKYGISVLAYGTLLGIISQLIFQLPFAYKNGFKYRPTINIKDENIKKLIFLVLPVLVGVSINQVNAMVDRTLASTLGADVVSSFNYANKLYYFVQGLFITSIITVIYPKLAHLLSKEDVEGFKISLTKGINVIMLLIIPISIGTIILAKPVVRLVFERGAFTPEATAITATILTFYAMGMLAYGLNDIMCRAFYSLKDTKTPMISGSIVVLINIVLNIILIKYLGYAGLAIASAASAYIGIIIMFTMLNKKVGNFKLKKVIITGIKSLIAALIMGFVTKLSYNYLHGMMGIDTISQIINIGISVLIGIIVYFLMILMLKIEETNLIVGVVKNKLKK